MAKSNRLLIYGGLAALAVVGYFATEPDPEPAAEEETTSRRSNRSSGSVARGLEAFNEDDEKATFARLDEPVKNVFRPLVARSGAAGGSGSGTTLAPNQIPPYLVGGETGWFYTGTAYLDNVPSVLIENAATGEGNYFRVGERFKNATISRITPNSVVMTGAQGVTATLVLIENRPIVDDPTQFASNQPLNPLTGPIGLNANDQSNSDRTRTSDETSANNNSRNNQDRNLETTNDPSQ